MIFLKHRIKTLITIAWLAILIASLISGCGNAVDQNVDEGNDEGVKEIILYSPDKDKKPLYKLFIPSEYGPYAYRGLASLKAAYPGMVAFSPEIKSRFYNEKGAWGPTGSIFSLAFTLNISTLVLIEKLKIEMMQGDLPWRAIRNTKSLIKFPPQKRLSNRKK